MYDINEPGVNGLDISTLSLSKGTLN